VRSALRFLRERGKSEHNERQLFWAHDEVQRLAAQAVCETRRARRQRARRESTGRERELEEGLNRRSDPPAVNYNVDPLDLPVETWGRGRRA
jgi:hypothetical protein